MSRMYRNVQRGSNAGNDFFMEPTTPPFSSLPSSQRKNGEESPSDFSPGLLDLHSFVTELLPEVGVTWHFFKELMSFRECIFYLTAHHYVRYAPCL